MRDPEPRLAREQRRGGGELPAVRCFAALGDSFTAGTGCPPGSRWTDRLAQSLRARSANLVHRNFAVDGATSTEVMGQLWPALRLEPDFVSLICGVNDVLFSVRPDVDGYAARLDSMFDQLKRASRVPLVVTATAPEDMRFLDLGPRSLRRVHAGLREINEHTRRLAAAHRVHCLDVSGHPGLDDPANFQADGLHPSALGHARTCAVFERLLGERASLGDPRGRWP
jgi:lysophospholipase L1-like esterase